MVIKSKGKKGKLGKRRGKKTKFTVGDVVARASGVPGLGVVAFVGPTHIGKGTWVGVAWTTASGKHNGTVDGHVYFEAQPGHGSLIKPSGLIHAPSPTAVSQEEGQEQEREQEQAKATFVTQPAAASSTAAASTAAASTAAASTAAAAVAANSYFSASTDAVVEMLAAAVSDETLAAVRSAGVTGQTMYVLAHETPDYGFMEAMEAMLPGVSLSQGRAAVAVFAALPPPPGPELIAAGHFDSALGEPVLLSEVREAMSHAIASTAKFPLLLDPSGTVQTFLRYAYSVSLPLKPLFMSKRNGGDWESPLRRALVYGMQRSPSREPVLWLDLDDSAVDLAGFDLPGLFPQPALTPHGLAADPAAVEALVAAFVAETPGLDPQFAASYMADPHFVVIATSSLSDGLAVTSLAPHLEYFTPLRIVLDNPLPGSAVAPPTAACIGCSKPNDYLLRAFAPES